MKNDDIIDILQLNSVGQKSLRRVRVTKLREGDSCYRLVGVNLRGKYPREYELPFEPVKALLQPGESGWYPFHNSSDPEA